MSSNNSQFQLPQFELRSTTVADQQTAGSDPAAWLWSQIGFGNQDSGKLISAANALAVNQKSYQLTSSSNVPLSNGVTTAAEGPESFNMSDVLEPGEVRLTSTEANIVNGVSDGHGLSELMLLREALSAKGKEAARLTRELERAYGLIQCLQQQNIMYQQLDWNFQQQPQIQQQGGEPNIDSLISGVRS